MCTSWVLLRASWWLAPLWQECVQKRDKERPGEQGSLLYNNLSRGLVRIGAQEKYLSSFWGYGQSPPRLFHICLLQCLTCCELSDPVHGQTPSEPQPRSNTWVLIIALWITDKSLNLLVSQFLHLSDRGHHGWLLVRVDEKRWDVCPRAGYRIIFTHPGCCAISYPCTSDQILTQNSTIISLSLEIYLSNTLNTGAALWQSVKWFS